MNSTISEYIKTSRLELGLTQDELAQRAGISVRYLCDIENDHGIPSDWVYESLQQALSNHEQNRMKWSAQLRKTRRAYGVEQEWFALQLGMTTKQLRALETGKTELPYQKRFEIMSAIERFNPENEPLSIMFDYMRIRFKTTDARYVLEKILRLNMKYVISEDGGVYGYSYRFTHGNILVLSSPDEEKGVLLELRGRGCREFECYLRGQKRSWYEFMRDCAAEGCVFKRIDLAINDHAGLLHVPTLYRKRVTGECVTRLRNVEYFASGRENSWETDEDLKMEMGHTLYLGSKDSDVYFCIYEKAQEQKAKFGKSIEDADILNRFELRLTNNAAENSADALMDSEDAAGTAFSIINNYVRFIEPQADKRRYDCPTDKHWEQFMQGEERKLKLTMKPKPFDLERTENWINTQVAKSIKMLQEIEKMKGRNFVQQLLDGKVLNEKHRKIVAQVTNEWEDNKRSCG